MLVRLKVSVNYLMPAHCLGLDVTPTVTQIIYVIADDYTYIVCRIHIPYPGHVPVVAQT